MEKNGEKFTADLTLWDLNSGDLLEVGKLGFLRVVAGDFGSDPR